MAPLDVPSPTPSSLAQPPAPANPKRPRPSAATASTAGPSRVKRRKADDNGADDDTPGPGGRGKQAQGQGSGMGKGREEDWGESSADVITKINFNALPDETLYKYLEYHDLLPRWTTSPWSEDPCTPPNALYTNHSHQANQPATDTQELPESSQDLSSQIVEPMAVDVPAAGPVTATAEGGISISQEPPKTSEDVDGAKPDIEGDEVDDEPPIAPTTRSKTAPFRKAPTPPPASPSPAPEVKRGVITLSDVAAARGVLAEKANAHWVKGLGGGQNKESETIVNFLYKMKAGPGRLLRLYNPYPPPNSY